MVGGPSGLATGSLAGLGVPVVVSTGVEDRGNGAGSGLALQAVTRTTARAATAGAGRWRRRRTPAVTTQTPPIGFQDPPEPGACWATYSGPAHPAIPRTRDCGRRPAGRGTAPTREPLHNGSPDPMLLPIGGNHRSNRSDVPLLRSGATSRVSSGTRPRNSGGKHLHPAPRTPDYPPLFDAGVSGLRRRVTKEGSSPHEPRAAVPAGESPAGRAG